MTNTAISVESVSKKFLLPHEKKTSVKSVFTGISKRKKGTVEVQQALDNISFEIEEGEFFGILGRNGSGKSTLLKMLAGIYQPTKGSIQVNGKLVPFIELGVGFNPDLTGRDNVYLNGALLGFSTKEIDKRYDEIVKFAELERFMDQKLKNYSSGMQVRLAFSVAVMAEADILLVDEVLAVGDADFQRKCFQYFHKLKREKKTVVFVSHDMGAIREYCDRAVLIEESKIVEIGNGEKIANLYTRMFLDQKEDALSVDRSLRWGDEKILFDKVNLNKKLITDKDEVIKLECVLTSQIDSPPPLYGFMIKDPNGNSIMGSNTRLMDVKTTALKKGKQVSVTWYIPNVFAEGVYTVSPAIVSDDGVSVHDWWDDALTFESRRAIKNPYPIQPNFEISIHDGE